MNNPPQVGAEFISEDISIETPSRRELPSFLIQYMERFGEVNFDICEDCKEPNNQEYKEVERAIRN
ncbi:MAG: hypothetical protein ACW98Y_11855 [Candidatus Thorarchaeota archaeon]|jgi:hypothetical protein